MTPLEEKQENVLKKKIVIRNIVAGVGFVLGAVNAIGGEVVNMVIVDAECCSLDQFKEFDKINKDRKMNIYLLTMMGMIWMRKSKTKGMNL